MRPALYNVHPLLELGIHSVSNDDLLSEDA